MRMRKLVVAALVVSERGEVLLTQRRADQAMPLKWELPGGKLEEGEGPEEALARELREELDVDALVGRVWDVIFHRYAEFDLVMLVYRCRLGAGQAPRCREVASLAWVAPARLSDYDVLPADAPLVARLQAEGVD